MAPSRPRPDYIPRLVDAALTETLGGLPAVMLVGPRACGKTTTARRHAATVVRLDRPLESGPFRDDPDTVLGELMSRSCWTSGNWSLMSWPQSSDRSTITGASTVSS